ncbi:MAG: hypothetical protein PHU25_08810 [Deltaproteobacteria bacterium]|nr:hypothetical protein [Deltaproteobacteria bacterium]
MPNITISIDEETLRASRRYAQEHKTSLNALIRRMLERTVTRASSDWVDECFSLMDEAAVRGGGRRWTRDEIHER